MAFLLKNQHNPSTRYSNGMAPVVEQWIRVARAADTLVQTGTETLFTISGGRIALKALIGEVTTVMGATASNLSIVVDSDAGAADDLASALASANDAVGTYYSVEGDGTALVKTGIGWGQACICPVIIGTGLIRLTTSGSNSGAVKWDLYYLPVDEAAYVVPAAI